MMPEFRVEWRDNLNRHLSDQGVRDVFDPMGADLQFMLPNADDAFVKQVCYIFYHMFLTSDLGPSRSRLQSEQIWNQSQGSSSARRHKKLN